MLNDAGVPAPLLRQVPGLVRLAVSEFGRDVDHTAAVRLVERWAGIELS